MSETYQVLGDYANIDLANFEYHPVSENQENRVNRMIIRDVIWNSDSGYSQAKKIYIKTPRMKIGHVDYYQDHCYLDLNFGQCQAFKDFVNIMDVHHIAQIHEHSDLWGLDPSIPMSEIEYLYVPTIKKSGYTFDDCLKLRFKVDDQVKIYDQEANIIDFRHFFDLFMLGVAKPPGFARVIGDCKSPTDYPIQALLYLAGIRFENGQFHTEWKPIQLRVHVKDINSRKMEL